MCNATNCIAGAFMSVRLSVCLSVKRVDCDKMKETCAHILITEYMKEHFILVF